MSISNTGLSKVLLIGKTPPPIGGVTIHVYRLLNRLIDTRNNVNFYDLNNFKVHTLIGCIIKNDVIHNHSNSRIFLFIVSVLCKLLNKKYIITIHGNCRSLGLLHSFFEKVAIKNSDIPIVLNEESFNYSIKHNLKTRRVSSFIEPIKPELNLSNDILELIDTLRYKFKCIIATNASSYAFDANGNEIYGIKKLVSLMHKFQDYALIISDPSSQYYEHFKKLPVNVFIITEKHSFCAVLNKVDLFVRATSTDGDSISIKESLFVGTPVIATNCVDRPKEVLTYNYFCIEELESHLMKKTFIDKQDISLISYSGFRIITELYESKVS